jgi:hypothetical protein
LRPKRGLAAIKQFTAKDAQQYRAIQERMACDCRQCHTPDAGLPSLNLAAAAAGIVGPFHASSVDPLDVLE